MYNKKTTIVVDGTEVSDRLASAGIIDAIIKCFKNYYGIEIVREEFFVSVEEVQIVGDGEEYYWQRRIRVSSPMTKKLDDFGGNIHFPVDSSEFLDLVGEPFEATIDQLGVVYRILEPHLK